MNYEPTIAELRAWRETVARGNFTLAAKALGLEQPTVHQHVNRLACKVAGGQEELYTYSQSRREIQPTRIGLELAEAAEGVLRALESATETVRAGRKIRRLCIAATLGVWDECVLPIVSDMKTRSPALIIEMLARGSSGALKALHRRRCDVAIVSANCAANLPESAEALDCKWAQNIELVIRKQDQDADWFLERLNRNRRSDDAPILRRIINRRSSPTQIILPYSGSSFRRHIESVFEQHAVDIPSIQSFDTSYTILNAAWQGLGRAIHQTWPKSPHDDELHRIPMTNLFGQWKHRVVWNKEAEDDHLIEFVSTIASRA